MITIRAIRSSSKFNTKEMVVWIARIFNRLAYNGVGVTNPGEIQNYWHQFKEYVNENKITIHDSILTQAEYKALNPICEGCGEYIADGSGELAHIRAIGMGGDRTKEPKRNYSSNWLHLCRECHGDIWHGKGAYEFLKLFKHLTYKVNTALNREYSEIDAGTDELENKNDIKEVVKEKSELSDFKGSQEELLEYIKKQYKEGKLERDQACIRIEELGGDPTEINPGWIGMF